MNIYYKNLFLKVILSLMVLLTIIPFSANASPGLTASVDRTKVTLGEEINLSLVAEEIGKIVDPELPAINGIQFYFKGTSSRTQIINGNVTSSETYNYSIVCNKIGKITIPPITLTVNGQKYTSEELVIEVTKTSDNSNIDNSKNSFVTVQVNNKNPYLNEQVVYTFKFYTKVQTDLFQKNFPDFKGFWVEDIGKDNVYDKIIDSQRYNILEVNKAIYPTRSGVIEIKPTTFLVEVVYQDNSGLGSIFSSTRKEVQKFVTGSIKLNVKDLPKAPQGFSGIVSNNLSLKSALTNERVKTGDSANLKIDIQGIGNINDLKKIPLKIKNTKIYEDKATEKSTVEGNHLSWEKNFNYSIIPLKKGQIDLPPTSVVYFNPKKEKYETLKTQRYKILSESGEQISDEKETINQNNSKDKPDDIEGIFENNNLSDQKTTKTLIIITCLFFIFSILTLIYLYFIKDKIDFSKFQIKGENKKLIQKINSENTFNSMYKLLKEYLSYKFNINNLNEDNIKNKINDEMISNELIKVIQEYDFINFSGINNSQKEKEIIDSTKKIINKVEARK